MPSHKCENYCCSTFRTFQDENLSKIPDLNNPIHPIFRRQNFPYNSDEDYEILEQPLRLASLLLESDAALPFILRTFDGRLQLGEDEVTTSLAQYYKEFTDEELYSWWDDHLVSRPDQAEANPQNRERVSKLLNAFADMVGFDVRPLSELDKEENPSYDEDTSGYANISEGPLTRSAQQIFPRGCRCYIWISSNTPVNYALDDIRKLMAKDPETGKYSINCNCDPGEVCNCYNDLFISIFMLAETFVHESAHAMWTAWVGPCAEKPHTHGAYPEQGKDICNEIVGGLINFKDSDSILSNLCALKEGDTDDFPQPVHARDS